MRNPGLIINADDFGLRKSINDSIVLLMESGVVTSTTILVKRDFDAYRDAISNALRLQKIHGRELSFGLHLDLDNFFRFDETGHYGNNESDIIGNYIEVFRDNRDGIVEEIKSQIKSLTDTGLLVSHLDGHHAIHCFPEILEETAPLLKENKIRFMRFNPGFYLSETNLRETVKILDKYNIGRTDYFLDLSDLIYKRVDSSRFNPETIIEAMAHTEIEVPEAEEWRLGQHKFLMESKKHLSHYHRISFNQLPL